MFHALDILWSSVILGSMCIVATPWYKSPAQTVSSVSRIKVMDWWTASWWSSSQVVIDGNSREGKNGGVVRSKSMVVAMSRVRHFVWFLTFNRCPDGRSSDILFLLIVRFKLTDRISSRGEGWLSWTQDTRFRGAWIWHESIARDSGWLRR